MSDLPYPVMPINGQMIDDITSNMKEAGCTYQMGAKAPSLDCDSSQITAIDCSGFVRYALARATNQYIVLPDGSANQHAFIEDHGYKVSTVENGLLQDGAWRIFFLSPRDGGGTGHVGLIKNGTTYESHGGVGPDCRVWGSHDFMKRCTVYVLTLPTVEV